MKNKLITIAIFFCVTQSLIAQNEISQSPLLDPETKTVRWDLVYKNLETKYAKKVRTGSLGFNEVGPSNIAGRINALVIKSGYCLAAADNGGIWRNNSISGTGSWTSVYSSYPLDYYNFTSLATPSLSSPIIYASTGFLQRGNYQAHDQFRPIGNGLIMTNDHGSTWNPIAITQPSILTGGPAEIINKIVVANNGDVFMAAQRITSGTSGILFYRPSNNTLNLIPNASGNNGVGFDVVKAANGDIWVAFLVGGNRVISRLRLNSSNTYDKLDQRVFTTGTRIALATAPSDANIIYAINVSGPPAINSIIRTANGATSSSANLATWTTLPIPATSVLKIDQITRDLALTVDPLNPNTVVLSSLNICKTTNANAVTPNWTAVSQAISVPFPHADAADFYFKPGSSTEAYACNDGGIYRTSNMNTTTPTWVAKNNGLNVTQFYSCATPSNATDFNFIGGTQDNGHILLQGTTNSGLTAGQTVSSGDGFNTFMGDVVSGKSRLIVSHNGTTNHTFESNFYPKVSSTFPAIYGAVGGGATTCSMGTTNLGSTIQGNGNISMVPSDYDNLEEVLFTKGDIALNQLKCFLNVGVPCSTSSTVQNFTISNLNSISNHITCIKASKNSAKTFYIGTNTGMLIKCVWTRGGAGLITDPIAGITSTIIPIAGISNTAFISSIDLQGTNDAEILITTSNSGSSTQNIFYRATAAGAFTALESTVQASNAIHGLPIWCAKFIDAGANNTINAKIVIGTEIGVYYTTNINGVNTIWTADVNSPNIRITQMQYRKASDGLLLISTFGRGIWWSQAFTNFNYSFTATLKDCQLTLTNTSTTTGIATWDINGDGIADKTGNFNNDCTYGTTPNTYITMTVNGVSISAPLVVLPNTPGTGGTAPIYPCCLAPQRLSLNTNKLLLYPNPVTNILNIHYPNNMLEFGYLKIYNSMGQLVYSSSSPIEKINTLSFARGMYIVKTKINSELNVQKFIKE
jgi:hypothetical protein